MLPSGMPNSNRKGCDVELKAATVWKWFERNDDDNERAYDEISN